MDGQEELGRIRLPDMLKAKMAALPQSAIFIVDDFLDLSGRGTVRGALARLARKGEIRRIFPGIYDRPHFSRLLNAMAPPSMRDLPYALARKHHWRIAPEGNAALNMLGLDTQVPAKSVYNSTGPSRIFRCGRAAFHFRHVAPRFLKADHELTLLIVQAMMMGPRYFGEERMRYLLTRLSEKDKEDIRSDLVKVPGEFRAAVLKVASSGEKGG